jgi:hypothetical protein
MSTLELSRFCATRPAEADILLVEDDRRENEMYAAALRRAGLELCRRVRSIQKTASLPAITVALPAAIANGWRPW